VELSAKIYVAGHLGLLGSALVRCLRTRGYHNLLLRTHRQLDLTDQHATDKFLTEERPQFVFLAAAKVGGIFANYSFPADFVLENLKIETNVISASHKSGVDRLLFLGSSCIYPKLALQPLRESSLLTGPLEFTNRPYAVAKLAGIEMCWALNRQYRTQFLAAMPTNLYGPGDRYDGENSHLVPALFQKIHQAKAESAECVVVWGTGRARREFLYSEDAADACIFLMELPEQNFGALVSGELDPPLINVGWGQDIAVKELAEMVAEVVGFKGQFVLDSTKPDGTPRKLLDTSRLSALGWKPRMDLRSGLSLTYLDFLSSLVEATSTHA
jgi:GDP-L-fucose synthase